MAVLLAFILPSCNGGESEHAVTLSGAQILQKVEQASKTAEPSMPYTEIRHYSLRNDRFKREPEMDVRVVHRELAATSYEVLNVIGSQDVYQRVFKKLPEGEAQLSRLPAAETAVTSANSKSSCAGPTLLKAGTVTYWRCFPAEQQVLITGTRMDRCWELHLDQARGTSHSEPLPVGRKTAGHSRVRRGRKGARVAARSDTTSSTPLLGTTELTIKHRDRQLLLEPSAFADARAVLAIGAVQQ